jgi:uncharacterized DUF497 family protein
MEISFDPAKDAANIQERGIPLAFGAVILARAVGELEDTRQDYGEVRQRAFAKVHSPRSRANGSNASTRSAAMCGTSSRCIALMKRGSNDG